MSVLQIDPRKKVELFFNLKKIKRITEWDDIKVGGIYHMPPLVYNDRMDFRVVDKTDNNIKIVKIGDEHSQTMFKTDITSNFIVKKWCSNEI
jgi:hypothetical protein